MITEREGIMAFAHIQREARRLVDREEAAQQKVTLERVSLRELIARPRPKTPPELIKGIHRIGHNTTITAKYKTGKTTFAANLLRSLVDGDPFLDFFKVADMAGRVGFLNYELAEPDMLDWLAKLKIRNDDRVAVLNLRETPFSLVSDANCAELVGWCRDQDIQVLWLDPHRRAMQGWGSENSNDDINNYTGRLDALKREAGVTDLFTAVHTGRPNGEDSEERARGATALDDWADNRLVLSRAADGSRFCRIEEGRTASSVSEFKLEMDPETHHLTADWVTRRAHEDDSRREQLLEVIGAAGSDGLTKNQLVKALGYGKGLPKGYQDTLKDLVEEAEIVVKEGPGKAQIHVLGRHSNGS